MSLTMSNSEIIREVAANAGLPAKLLVLGLRGAQKLSAIPLIGLFTRALYRVLCIALRVDIPVQTQIGPGLRVFHPFCIVIHPDVRIGKRCLLRHGVTLGNRFENDPAVPIIGDDVQFGCFAVVVGRVVVESGQTVKALSLITS